MNSEERRPAGKGQSIMWVAFFLLTANLSQASCGPNLPADVTGDCRVDFNDFAVVASDWLKPAVTHEWIARYDGMGNADDLVYSIATDDIGNIYVTGESWSGTDYDYATIKYDSDGNEIWVAYYNGPVNGLDGPIEIVTDKARNSYVTGFSDGFGTDWDYATIKYDADGNEVWVARYNGSQDDKDFPVSMTIDDLNNVYVTGCCDGFGTDQDCATIKYDPDGNEVWVSIYDGPANSSDGGRAIAIDGSGNVYVTGSSSGLRTYCGDYADCGDYATIKYDPDGNEVWVARYDVPADGHHIPTDIFVDNTSNVYVTGFSYGAGTKDDYATIKYDADGNEVWVARYNGPGNIRDCPRGIGVDLLGNIYVTGCSKGAGTDYDYATIKYEPDGNEVWVARYNGPSNGDDRAGCIAIDLLGNIYVTGGSEGLVSDFDYATIKYDSNGNQVWLGRYNGPGNDQDEPYGIAIDNSGNIYVTGYSFSSTDSDYATIKYSPDYSCTPEITGDFTHDCVVDFADLKILCDHWLEEVGH